MDDKDRQPSQDGVQEAREKGAALEYDAEDENALGDMASAPDRDNSPPTEEK